MLPKKKRVTKNLFLSIMKDKEIIYGSFFVFYYKKQIDPQYAFVAPKNVARKATDRNKLRRKGYNAIRLLNVPSGAGLFFYKKSGVNATSQDIKTDISFLLKKANFIK